MELSLNSPWYEHVRDGRKQYEGRRYTPQINALQSGDPVVFKHHTEPDRYPEIHATVIQVMHFPTFRDALLCIPIENVLPGVTSVDEGDLIYQRFVSLSTQHRDGVCMIHICR
jgi:ASC-1-like (ASCH) protein